MKVLLVFVSGLATAIIFALPLKLLGNEPQSEFVALAVVVYVILGCVAVGFVPLWLLDRLRPR